MKLKELLAKIDKIAPKVLIVVSWIVGIPFYYYLFRLIFG